MIIKGKSRSGAGSLAHHLGNAEKNERVQLIETRGTLAEDLRGALIEMEAVASGTRCEKSLYHAALSPEPPHRLTPEQRLEAIDALEKKLGLEDHARVIVLHEKLGREHVHIVWSRIDIDRMKAIPDSHNYRKHEEVSRDLERRFGHARIQGAHAEREGVKRPNRTPSRAELRLEERTGVKGKDVREEVSAAFRESDGPQAFKAALEERGYQLARGDRRDYVVVDQAGGIHGLARRIGDMKAAELRQFMAPLDKADIPTVGEALKPIEERLRQMEAADIEDLREKGYSRGASYVSQSRQALADHKRRQAELDVRHGQDSVWQKIEAGEVERDRQRNQENADDAERRLSLSDGKETSSDIEMTDAMQARLDRLREAKADYSPAADPSRQRQAPGGGRTRSR